MTPRSVYVVGRSAALLVLLVLGAAPASEAREQSITEYVLTTILDQFTDYDTVTEVVDHSSCRIRISKDLGRISPVFVYPDTVQPVRAINANGALHFIKGDAIQVACPGRDNYLIAPSGRPAEAVAHCEGGKQFSVKGAQFDINQLTCKKWPEHIVYKNGTCLYGKSLVKTAFNISTGLVPLSESCYDAKTHATIYTKYVLSMDSDGSQTGVKRPSWKEMHLFGHSGADDLYKRTSQLKTFAQLLSSETLAQKYISLKSDRYLSRGHLMAKTDHLFAAGQHSTFSYVNAAPQWQTFNGGNWNALENAVRKLAARLGKDLTCYTGTYGIATLPDINGTAVPLYLNPINHTIPVPQLFFKALYDPDTRAAIVFAGMNNPFESLESVQQNVRCRDICSTIPWMKWKYQDLAKGYTFCCELNDFRNNYPDVLPSLPATSILR